MAQVFDRGKAVTTTTSFVDVVNDLTPGAHEFTLVVVDEDGNQSAAAKATITVRKATTGGPIVTGPIITGPIIERPVVVGPGNPIGPVAGPVIPAGPVVVGPTILRSVTAKPDAESDSGPEAPNKAKTPSPRRKKKSK